MKYSNRSNRYNEVSGIGWALERMSRRVTRANPLAGGEAGLVRHYHGLNEDFRGFMPLVRSFAEAFIAGESLIDMQNAAR